MPFYGGYAKWGTPVLGTTGGTVTYSTTDGSGNHFADSLNYSSSYTTADFDAALLAAFDAWESVASIDFQLVSSSFTSDFDVLSFPMELYIAGQATLLPYTQVGTIEILPSPGNFMAFNSNSLVEWAPTADGDPNTINFFAVAMHEIGHILGFDHVNDPNEIMNPVVYEDSNSLGPGDIAGAQYVYGVDPGDAPIVTGETNVMPALPPGYSTGGGDGGGGGGGGLILGLLAAIFGFIFGGPAGAGAALAASRFEGEDDSGSDDVAPTSSLHVHSVFSAEHLPPGTDFDDLMSLCGHYGPCDCAMKECYEDALDAF